MNDTSEVRVGDLRQWEIVVMKDGVVPCSLFTILETFERQYGKCNLEFRSRVMYNNGQLGEEPSDFIRRYSVLIRRVTHE